MPAAKAHRVRRSRWPVVDSRPENPSAIITGTRPTVESAWLCAAESALPISFERIAQTPHERSAARDHRSQRGMFGRFQISSTKLQRNPRLQSPNGTAWYGAVGAAPIL